MNHDEPVPIQERFNRVVDARRKAVIENTNRPKFVDKVAEQEKQRQQWTSSNRTTVKPDAALVEARANWEAEQSTRKAASQAPAQITLSNPLTDEEEFLLARSWADSNPEWYASEYNANTLKQILEAYDLPHTKAGYDTAFRYAKEHHHLEESPSRKRGFRMQHAPALFNPPKSAAPVGQPRTHAGNTPVRIVPQQISPEEEQRLRGISLDELRKEARSGMRAYNGKKGEQHGRNNISDI